MTAIAKLTGLNRSSLIPILREVKERYRGIDGYAMQVIADVLHIHPVEVQAVATFYAFLRPETEGRYVFRLCRTLSCEFAGKDLVAEQLEESLGIGFGETSPGGAFTLQWTNCMGMCDQGPAMLVNDTVYALLTPSKARAIVEEYLTKAELQGMQPVPERAVETTIETRVHGLTFDTVTAGDGLTKALAMSRGDIIDLVRYSKLKGRGGAGFPTGMKWDFVAAEKGEPKYIICNANEGEPGTFKDRVILTHYPDLVIEGMTIGAQAMGASLGLIYLRAEYAYLRPHLEEVIEVRRADGLLREKIGGIAGFDFRIVVGLGAGAYVCGEETALIESLEGFRGEPRTRPPFPVVSGFLHRPSVVNNVETLAWVACIFAKGVDWFKSSGTASSVGRKLFSVSGDCARPGVYEFPFGISIVELLEKVGGENAKAVQVGGASGRCVPRSAFSRRISFEDIPTGGSIMVIGPGRDMLAVARNLLEFFVDESCGQCTPCRLGNRKLLEGVKMLVDGTCTAEYLSDLRALSDTMQVASKCGLGQSSSVAFCSIIENFGDEIMGHAKKSR